MSYLPDSAFHLVPMNEWHPLMQRGCIVAALGLAGATTHFNCVAPDDYGYPYFHTTAWMRGGLFLKMLVPVERDPDEIIHMMCHVDHVVPPHGKIVPIAPSNGEMGPLRRLARPVWFISDIYKDPGVSLVDALNGVTLARDETRRIYIPERQGKACVSWPGYYTTGKTIYALTADKTISIDELLGHLAAAVDKVISEGHATRDLSQLHLPPPELELGRVRPEDVVIVGALNLHWQPALWFPILRHVPRPV
ncbi:hypothetical protein FA95DRAFT_1606299 [Auriscalpium vulgare]|uniref:Uncharacterized protein n=1 Tax=Auriscalpium vulgare TaxID=40419 RepID=A0ACB8RSQ1_9AGAM|nr:hypothetical protein FA95DRAFT_1606299 [Auriscalpium vulgare]